MIVTSSASLPIPNDGSISHAELAAFVAAVPTNGQFGFKVGIERGASRVTHLVATWTTDLETNPAPPPRTPDGRLRAAPMLDDPAAWKRHMVEHHSYDATRLEHPKWTVGLLKTEHGTDHTMNPSYDQLHTHYEGER